MTFCSEEPDSVSEALSPLQDPLSPRFILRSFGFLSGETMNNCCQFTFSMTPRISQTSVKPYPVYLCHSITGGAVYSSAAHWNLFPYP